MPPIREEFEPDSPVWFEDGKGKHLVPGTVVEEQENAIIVQSHGKAFEVPYENVQPREDTGPEGVDDLIQLPEIHEGAVLYNIKKRYQKGQIYTYLGQMLYAVNPYQPCSFYDLDIARTYHEQLLGKLPAHVFGVANATYYNMLKTKKNQIIFISGESGSGKTESKKIIMQYFASSFSKKSTLKLEQIIESTRILESFGNAKTLINNNSSRFGTFTEIMFDMTGSIIGSNVQDYLFERTRLTFQADGDRNFHVFYEFLAGLAVSDRKEMGLLHGEDFFYLNQGSNQNVTAKDDHDDFRRLLLSMDIFGITAEERKGIFCILGAILHLGNVYYGRSQQNGREVAVIVNHPEVEFVSKLLQVNAKTVADALTQKIHKTSGEVFHQYCNVEEALDSRDTLARTLYMKLFTWLTNRINQKCAPKTGDDVAKYTIGLMDFSGFEEFEVNGFEQFGINFTDEVLHAYAMKFIFEFEQEEYALEEIQFEPMEDVNTHQGCFEMLHGEPSGIVNVLRDVSNHPQASDGLFLEEIHQEHSGNELYIIPKIRGPEFGIYHYAGFVKYQVDLFIDKNCETIHPDAFKLATSSKSPFVSGLFPDWVEASNLHIRKSAVNIPSGAQARGQQAIKTAQEKQYLTSHKDKVQQLLDKIKKIPPIFIRCIRPNTEQIPGHIQDTYISLQLQYYSTLDTIDIRKNGFPIKVSHKVFTKRYKCLYNQGTISLRDPPENSVQLILSAVQQETQEIQEEFQIGQSMVLMKESFELFMEDLRFDKLHTNTVIIQKNFKAWYGQKHFQKKKDAALIIQGFTRCHGQRNRYQRMLKAVLTLQSVYRRYKYNKRYGRSQKNEVNRVHARQREYLSEVHISERAHYDEEEKDITRFDIPADLAVVFSRIQVWEPLHVDYNICAVTGVTPWEYCDNSLPKDMDLCLFSKFIRQYFQKSSNYSHSQSPIKTSLLRLKNFDSLESIKIFKLILRFMEDHSIQGLRQLLVGNYIINKGIWNTELRDEIFSQLCKQLFKNPRNDSIVRGWLLMGLCLCTYPPSPRMYTYLLKFIGDYSFEGYNKYLQKKLLSWKEGCTGRIYPPTLIEWKSLKENAHLCFEARMADGYNRVIEVVSSSLCEEVAKSFLSVRKKEDLDVTGWSFSLQFESLTLDAVGSETFFDLISVLEQPPGFPYSTATTIISLDRTNRVPSGHMEIVIEAHKHINDRTMLDRLHQVFQHEREIPSEPVVFQPIDKIFQHRSQYSGEEYPLSEAVGFQPFDKPLKTGLEEPETKPQLDKIIPSQIESFPNNGDVDLPNETFYIKYHPEVLPKPPEPPAHPPPVKRVSIQQIHDSEPAWNQQQQQVQREYIYQLYEHDKRDEELHQFLKNERMKELNHLNKDIMEIEMMEKERTRLFKEKQEALSRLQFKPPPIAPPPPPLLPSSTNPTLRLGSRGNTIIRPKPKVRKKTPWSMEEVLLKHKQMKPRVEQRYHASHSDDPVLDDKSHNFEKQLYEKIVDLKTNDPYRYGISRPPPEVAPKPAGSIFRPKPLKYIDIQIEPVQQDEDIQKLIQDRKSGLKKSTTKNLQDQNKQPTKVVKKEEMQRRADNFDMKNLLKDTCIGLPDKISGNNSSKKKRSFNNKSDQILKSQMDKLRSVEREDTRGDSPGGIDYKSMLSSDRLPIKPSRNFPKQTIVDLNADFRAAATPSGSVGKNSRDKNQESPSILGKSGESLSRKSKERLEKHGLRYERSRKPPEDVEVPKIVNHGRESASSVSAFVDKLFNPVFAENDLTSSDTLPEKLKGGPDFYPDRKSRNSHHSTRSTSPLIEQLLQQERQLEDALQNARAEKQSSFEQYSRNAIPEPPPTQTTTPWVPQRPQVAYDESSGNKSTAKSIRHLPTSIHKYINGFDNLVHKKEAEVIYNRLPPHIPQSYLPHVPLLPPPAAPPAPPPPPPLPRQGIAHYLNYRIHKGCYISYQNTQWRLYLKKEVFYPHESLHGFLKTLVYRQILEDMNSRTCARLSGEDQHKMQKILDSSTSVDNDIVKQTIIETAKSLPLYFSRIYKFSGYDDHLYNYLAVSHTGLRFAIRDTLDDHLRTVLHIPYTDVIDVRVKKEELHLETVLKPFVLHTRQAAAIKKMLGRYTKVTAPHQRYVKAISGHVAARPDYLSFKKGNIIKVYDKKNVDPGCMFGVLNGAQGMFPSSCVEEYDNSALTLAGWLPSTIPMHQKKSHFEDEDYDEQYTLIYFALRYFKPLPTSDGTRSEDGDDPDTRYLQSMTQYKKEAISGALINFNNKTLSRHASDVNRGIMKFMGDLRRDQNETDTELVYFILKIGRENLDLRDEIYCQIIRQTTFNTSDNKESCGRGWKLLMMCTSYFDCSKLLRPYMNKYFQNCSQKYKEFHAAATVCEANLSRSFKYNGRKHLPSQNELTMILQGKHCKYQNIYLPGNYEKLCKINTSSTVATVVKDVCEELDLPLHEEHEEYGLYVYLHDKKVFLPVEHNEYIFDLFLNLEKDKYKQFSLVFRKLVWFQGMRFANNLFTKVIYDQILPDVMNGYLLHHKGNRASQVRDQQTQNEVSLFAALQHRVKNRHQPPTVQEVANLIPAIVSSLLTPEQWMVMVHEHFVLVRHFTAMNARIKFLELLSAWYYFGSSFFYVTTCSHPAVTDRCVLAVNKNGVQFLATNKRDTLLAFTFKEIISTRYFSNDKGKVFVDFRCGNLMNQRSIRLETPRGKEISNVVQKYIDSVSETLKPKESIMSYVYH